MAVRSPLSKHFSTSLERRPDEDMEEGIAYGSKDPSSTVEDFNCPLCFDVLLDPVTLVCGHTYCEICLARLWKNEAQNWRNRPPSILCPSCRNPTDKFPQVHFMLRNVIESKPELAKGLAERREQFTEEERRLLDLVKSSRSSDRQQAESARNQQQNQGLNFRFNVDFGGRQNNQRANTLCICATILIALCLVIAVLLYSSGEESHERYIESWSPEDVAEWCTKRFHPWGEELAQKLLAENVDGKRLLSLEEEEVLYIWDGSQFRIKTFIVAISQLKQGRPVRQPRTLTEFNEYFFKDSVRFVLIYQNLGLPNMAVWTTYFTNYEYMFLPFFHYVRSCQLPFVSYFSKSSQPGDAEEQEEDMYIREQNKETAKEKGEDNAQGPSEGESEKLKEGRLSSSPSMWQLLLFWVLLLLVSPHVFVAYIAGEHFTTNPLVCTFVMIYCGAGIYDHITFLLLYWKVGIRATLKLFFEALLQSLILDVVFYVLWWFLPMFVWSIVFYFSIFGIHRLNRLRRLQN